MSDLAEFLRLLQSRVEVHWPIVSARTDEEAAREAVQRLIDQAVEVAADDTPLLTAVQDARAAVATLWGAR